MAISGVADLTGRVLAGRYRLLAPIGAGASGRVYVADDVRLRRRVAVKVLHAALADDAGFLRRFRSEAQVAASLHHPNVMAVYDWGDDEVPFMVLELLQGGSLRGMLDAGTRLTPSQAAHVGGQVTAALEYAHARGLVHRDIKPANLLFDEHGIARVADFGLARALAEASWTEPAGAVVGTARYAAPEQGTGARLDGRADLYALAVVLVESVTGTVPNVGETAVGTVTARMHTPLSAPLALGRIGPVVERAGRPDPDERYPDAQTMHAALADAARMLPAPQSLVLAGIDGEHVGQDPTQFGRAPQVFDQDAPPEPVVVASPRARRRGQGPSRWVPIAVLVAVLLAVVAGGVAIARTAVGGSVAVPSVVGATQADAEAALTEAGLGLEVETRRSDDPAGTVIEQSPAAGSFTRDGDDVSLVVSSGPAPVALPPVVGIGEADAVAQLSAAGFVPRVDRRHDETVPAGTVLAMDPAGPKAAPESVVTLTVSDGPAPVAVPADLVGKTYDEAAKALTDRGFAPQRVDEFADAVENGKVIRTDPAAGALAPRGASVSVVVSKGPELITIPASLIGKSLDAATAILSQSGLQLDKADGYRPGRVVISAEPGVGTQVPKNTKVTLNF